MQIKRPGIFAVGILLHFLSVIKSLFLSVCALTSESFDLESLFLVYR